MNTIDKRAKKPIGSFIDKRFQKIYTENRQRGVRSDGLRVGCFPRPYNLIRIMPA